MLKKVVFTGPPCAGKTTLIGMLEKLGFRCTPEMATKVIKEGKFLPWVDATAFRREVLACQLDAERSHSDSRGLLCLDRGAFDGIAYCRATNVAVPDFLNGLGGWRYALVFLLEPLPVWESDGVRYEDPAFARVITPTLETVYKESGALVIRVPFGTPEERLRFVLDTVRRELDPHPLT